MYHLLMLPGKRSGSGQQSTAIMAAATAISKACGAQSAACLSAYLRPVWKGVAKATFSVDELTHQ